MNTDNLTVKKLKEKFPDSILKVEEFRGDLAITVDRKDIVPICTYLKTEESLQYNLMCDICGVDYLGRRNPRFEVVYHLYSIKNKHRVRLKAPVPEEDPTIDSVYGVWKAANWFEREAYDLFGIKFKGHPNLRRILTHEDFKGHALRKDYPVNKRQPLSRPVSFAPEE